MKTVKIAKPLLVIVPVLLIALFLSGCGAQRQLAESPETGITLQYKMPADPGVIYKSSTNIKQSMELQGQVIDSDIESELDFTLEPKEEVDGDLLLEITIDSMAMNVMSPMAQFSADVDNVLGKSFVMKISGKGEELDVSGAESIQYSIAQTGNRSVAMNFQEFFPDLPEQKIKIGDTWTETDTITEKSETEDVTMILESQNQFAGIENIGGFDCVKIVSTMKGPRKGSQTTPAITLVTDGETEGTMILYFAWKEGLFVKSTMTSKVKSTVTASGAQNLSFPMDMEVTSNIEMLKK